MPKHYDGRRYTRFSVACPFCNAEVRKARCCKASFNELNFVARMQQLHGKTVQEAQQLFPMYQSGAMRFCVVCSELFLAESINSRTGWRRVCSDCRKDTYRTKMLKTYGITPEEYAALLVKQGGVCAICKEPPKTRNNINGKPGIHRLCVDHDHVTGAVRGLLCHSCNVGLAQYSDRPDLLRAAASYIEGGDI